MLNGSTVNAPTNHRIKLTIYPGHYATSHAHVDTYISMTEIRCDAAMASEVASELANKLIYTRAREENFSSKKCDQNGKNWHFRKNF